MLGADNRMAGYAGCAVFDATSTAGGRIAAIVVLEDSVLAAVELASEEGVNIVTATPDEARYIYILHYQQARY
jgi:hypothetical protein